MAEEETTYELANQRATIKLIKMSKGYNWEAKLISKDGNLTKEQLDRLEEINNDCIQRYGSAI